MCWDEASDELVLGGLVTCVDLGRGFVLYFHVREALFLVALLALEAWHVGLWVEWRGLRAVGWELFSTAFLLCCDLIICIWFSRLSSANYSRQEELR